ncbi:MAG: hypothetical protein AAB410_04455 [Patescibacteria group bacterium]
MKQLKNGLLQSASEYFNKCIDGVVRLAGDVRNSLPGDQRMGAQRLLDSVLQIRDILSLGTKMLNLNPEITLQSSSESAKLDES